MYLSKHQHEASIPHFHEHNCRSILQFYRPNDSTIVVAVVRCRVDAPYIPVCHPTSLSNDILQLRFWYRISKRELLQPRLGRLFVSESE